MNIVLERCGSDYYFKILNYSNILYESFQTSFSYLKNFRYCCHNEFVSIYVNENWVHTFFFANIIHPEFEDLILSIESSGSTISLTNVRVVDLCDWREAIFIDFDTVAANAISSVIQQRPVEMNPDYLGQVKFEYSVDENRDTVELFQKLIISHEKVDSDQGVSSDAIVYGNYVEVITSEPAASRYGFVTRIIRVPELETGATRAARVAIKQAIQKATQHTLILRSDLRIEIGDVLECDYILSGTGKIINIKFIVESIQVRLSNAIFQMTITGRDYEVE